MMNAVAILIVLGTIILTLLVSLYLQNRKSFDRNSKAAEITYDSAHPDLQGDKGLNQLLLTDITATTATVYWETKQEMISYLEYGLTPTTLDTLDTTDTEPDIEHTYTLNGLKPGTVYYYRLTSTDANEQVAVSPIFSFSTRRK